ncbi:MAG: long-chain N-acyl amino acid synthase [Burkholderiales bacterium]|jgi:hypothetical protein|nr:long-chain N-acyl amino acid synthase [Burkholderiales bacterium]
MHDSECTIIEIPYQGGLQLAENTTLSGICKIRFSRSGQGLLSRMYASRGYVLKTALAHDCHVSNLVMQIGEQTVGTLSVRLDRGDLAAEQLYPEFIGELRAQGASICEFGSFAVDSGVRSKRLLGAIFHIAVLVALDLRGASDIVIEVNPRHADFYRRMLNFKQVGPERMCARVLAPAVLLHIDAETLRNQIDRFGGRPEWSAAERSFYPYFFHPDDEAGLLQRLRPKDV